jgi:hypothetical protein
MRVSAVAKTIVALVGSAVAVLTPLVGDGLITTADGVQIAIAVLTALGVFAVPNAPQAPVAPVRSVRDEGTL